MMPTHDRPTSRLNDHYYVKVNWRGQILWATTEQSGPFLRFAAAHSALLADAFKWSEIDSVKTAMKGTFIGASTELITCTNEMLTNKQLHSINVRTTDENS